MDAVVYATALLEARGRGDPGLMPPAGRLMPPSRVPRARLGARRPFPANFLFLKVKLVDLVGRVCRWDESAGGESHAQTRGHIWETGTAGAGLPALEEGERLLFFFNYCFKVCSPASYQSTGKHSPLFFKQLL